MRRRPSSRPRWATPQRTIQALVQRLGVWAEAQTQVRLKEATAEKAPQRAATELAVLMLDGFQARFRARDWASSTAKSFFTLG